MAQVVMRQNRHSVIHKTSSVLLAICEQDAWQFLQSVLTPCVICCDHTSKFTSRAPKRPWNPTYQDVAKYEREVGGSVRNRKGRYLDIGEKTAWHKAPSEASG